MPLSPEPNDPYEFGLLRIGPTGKGGERPVEWSVIGHQDPLPGVLQLDTAQLLMLEHDPDAYGKALGAMLFDERAIGPVFRTSLDRAVARGKAGVRVRLYLDDPALHAIHWERAYQPLLDERGQIRDWQPLGAAPTTPFSRYIQLAYSPAFMPETEQPIRILAVISAPAALESYGLGPIDDREREALHHAFDFVDDRARVTFLETGTADAPTGQQVLARLAEGFHVVHFLCHGRATEEGTVLYLEDGGKVQPVPASALVNTIENLREKPQLCVFSACETASSADGDPYAPLGVALLKQGGVPAVVAMAGAVGVETSREFMRLFYWWLFARGVIDTAMNAARLVIKEKADWGAPVLFSCSPNNRLFYDAPALVYEQNLSHGRAVSANVARVLPAVAQSVVSAGQRQLVDNLQALVEELRLNYLLLVGFANPFLKLDPHKPAFPKKFAALRRAFKERYREQTWTSQKASCRRIAELRDELMPSLQPLLSQARYDELMGELQFLGSNDTDILSGFSEYLNTMSQAIDVIQDRIDAGDLAEAARLKVVFDRELDRGLDASRAILDEMDDSLMRMDGLKGRGGSG